VKPWLIYTFKIVYIIMFCRTFTFKTIYMCTFWITLVNLYFKYDIHVQYDRR